MTHLDRQIAEAVRTLQAARNAVDALVRNPEFTRRYRALGLRRDLVAADFNIETAANALRDNCLPVGSVPATT